MIQNISIHAPREGSDRFSDKSTHIISDFNPRSPRGERRVGSKVLTFITSFQSTLPARGATQYDSRDDLPPTISIHAPREGSDQQNDRSRTKALNFNPRSPRGERQATNNADNHNQQFQSTLPARGATLLQQQHRQTRPISIHAPREGSDRRMRYIERRLAEHFNPRSPRGERPISLQFSASSSAISIHAPREGSDAVIVYFLSFLSNFNPRSPRGERPMSWSHRGHGRIFQSTLPARGATMRYIITTPPNSDFNPRSPRGERPTV